LWLNDTSRTKLSEEVNRKLRARNTTAQLLAVLTDSERNNAQRYRQADGQTAYNVMPIVVVESAKSDGQKDNME